MIPLAFDLDNTLIATREANLAAWEAVGVDNPEEFRPAREWAPPDLIEAKAKVYPAFLAKSARMLPATELLFKHGGLILTAASNHTIAILTKSFPWLAYFEIVNQQNLEQKIALLNRKQPGIYFDDWEEAVQLVKERTSWQAVNVTIFNL